MEVPIPCECGGRVIVNEMQAGVRVTCRCGREIDVPSLVCCGECPGSKGASAHD